MKMEIIILTMSSKHGQYCVAGINPNTGEWVRLVSNNTETHGALARSDMMCENGTMCKVRDLVVVEIIRYTPIPYQPENVLLDTACRWIRIREVSLRELCTIHPPEIHTSLLGNKWAYITEERISVVGHSLVFVWVIDLLITHPEPKKSKAKFTYKNSRGISSMYENISVTDPDYYNNEFQTNHALMISLPDAPWEGRFYKFIAKIFPFRMNKE